MCTLLLHTSMETYLPYLYLCLLTLLILQWHSQWQLQRVSIHGSVSSGRAHYRGFTGQRESKLPSGHEGFSLLADVDLVF